MIKFTIGIDGDCWYCSNGLDIPDSDANFVFEHILKDAIEKFKVQNADYCPSYNRVKYGYCEVEIPLELKDCLEMTAKEYRQYEKDNSQFGVGA